MGDATVHARTGHLPAAFHVGPKLMWLKGHEPEASRVPTWPCSRATSSRTR